MPHSWQIFVNLWKTVLKVNWSQSIYPRVIYWTVYLLHVFGTQTWSSIRSEEINCVPYCFAFSLQCYVFAANTFLSHCSRKINSKVSVVHLWGGCLHYFLFHKTINIKMLINKMRKHLGEINKAQIIQPSH